MLTLPNILTLSRIIGVPVLVALMWWKEWHAGFVAAWVVYSLMGVTDYFDGYLARAQGTVSKLGVFLDPIADKIMVAAVILMLAKSEILSGWHVIAGLIILLREIAVSGLREYLAGLKVSVPVSKLAKWKTTFQIIALGSLILLGGAPDFSIPLTNGWINPASVGFPTLWAAALLTLITGWDYMRVGIKHMD